MSVTDTLRQNLEKRHQQKQGIDPVSEAAMDVVALERQREDRAIQQLEEKERMIAECYQFIGRVQGVRMMVEFGNISNLVWLNDIKKSGIYKRISGFETWEKFCKTTGYSARHIDDQLKNLEVLGVQFLETVSDFRVSNRDIRKLRQLAQDGTMQITDNGVRIGKEIIPWNAEYKEDIQEALERLIEAKDQIIEEKEAVIRANKKVIESKAELIKRQEKDLAKYEKAAEEAGPEEFERKFIQDMQNARITIEGWMNQFDPSIKPLPDGYTPRMANEMMITLQSLLRSIKASYDTAAEIYGDPDLDGPGWIPPHLRTGSEE